CFDIWQLPGLRSKYLRQVAPAIREQLSDNLLNKLHDVVADKRVSKNQNSNLVAIPLLPVVAAAPGEEVSHHTDLYQVRPDAVFAAPGPWCPHAEFTTCLRVKGRPRVPLAHGGYTLVVH